jgi:hypothetical protein
MVGIVGLKYHHPEKWYNKMASLIQILAKYM